MFQPIDLIYLLSMTPVASCTEMHNKAGLIPAKVRQWRAIGFLLTVLVREGFPKKDIGQINDPSGFDILADCADWDCRPVSVSIC